ncbi:MAG: hypothetical protein GYA50_02835 [Eubacteriaceae bacterium]|nr:hypothetical protein [Eubacteriaceae bacterium]
MTRAEEIMAITLLAAIVLAAIIIFIRVRISANKYKNFKKTREENINAFKRGGFLTEDAKVANDILAVYFDYTNKQFLVENYSVLKCETKLNGPYSLEKLTKVSLLVDGAEAGKNYLDNYKTVRHEDGTVDENNELANSVVLALYFDGRDTDKLEYELLNQKALKVSGVFKKCFSTAYEMREKFEEVISKKTENK